MRKALLLLITACFLTSPVMAQEMQSIFSGDIKSGGYGGPVVKINDIDGETGVWVGAKGGWIINHSLVIGAAGYGLVNKINETPIDTSRTRQLAGGYGGIILEYIYQPLSLVHLNTGILVGAGGVGHHFIDDDEDEGWDGNNGDAFFALEPNLGVEVNIARHIRCEIGASYLYTSGVELSDLEDEDLGGPAGYIALKFGEF